MVTPVTKECRDIRAIPGQPEIQARRETKECRAIQVQSGPQDPKALMAGQVYPEAWASKEVLAKMEPPDTGDLLVFLVWM